MKKFLIKEWGLILSLVVFSFTMLVDYHWNFMTHFTSLTSGSASELFLASGLLTVLTLAFLEGILGVDNATVLAIQVRHLPPEDAEKALLWGVWGAHLFRFIFLIAAGFILEQKWIMAIGGFYLVNMGFIFFVRAILVLVLDVLFLSAMSLVFFASNESIQVFSFAIPVWFFFLPLFAYSIYRYWRHLKPRNKAAIPEEGLEVSRFRWKGHAILAAIIAVEWTDILFSFDSIGAGVAITRDFWVLFWGAFFGVTCLRIFAKKFVKLLEKFPQLEAAAMLAVLIVGCKMTFEAAQDTLKIEVYHIQNWQTSLAILFIFVAAFFIKVKTPHIHEEKD
ncbi:MAG: hypothetical protein LDLANPLL_00719 [Turneriella sp.]|nr:hypothetical protein [Turneriella sp.]